LTLARAVIESGAPLDADAVERGLALAARAADAVSEGAFGYCLVVAQRKYDGNSGFSASQFSWAA
jgi:hypothetical protein